MMSRHFFSVRVRRLERRKRVIDLHENGEKIEVYPWKQFVEELWQDRIL